MDQFELGEEIEEKNGDELELGQEEEDDIVRTFSPGSYYKPGLKGLALSPPRRLPAATL